MRLPPGARISPELSDLLRRLLSKDPESRIDVHAALAHPWVQREPGQASQAACSGMQPPCRTTLAGPTAAQPCMAAALAQRSAGQSCGCTELAPGVAGGEGALHAAAAACRCGGVSRSGSLTGLSHEVAAAAGAALSHPTGSVAAALDGVGIDEVMRSIGQAVLPGRVSTTGGGRMSGTPCGDSSPAPDNTPDAPPLGVAPVAESGRMLAPSTTMPGVPQLCHQDAPPQLPAGMSPHGLGDHLVAVPEMYQLAAMGASGKLRALDAEPSGGGGGDDSDGAAPGTCTLPRGGNGRCGGLVHTRKRDSPRDREVAGATGARSTCAFDLGAMCAVFEEVCYEPQQCIVSTGEPMRHIFLILTGSVELYRMVDAQAGAAAGRDAAAAAVDGLRQPIISGLEGSSGEASSGGLLAASDREDSAPMEFLHSVSGLVDNTGFTRAMRSNALDTGARAGPAADPTQLSPLPQRGIPRVGSSSASAFVEGAAAGGAADDASMDSSDSASPRSSSPPRRGGGGFFPGKLGSGGRARQRGGRARTSAAAPRAGARLERLGTGLSDLIMVENVDGELSQSAAAAEHACGCMANSVSMLAMPPPPRAPPLLVWPAPCGSLQQQATAGGIDGGTAAVPASCQPQRIVIAVKGPGDSLGLLHRPSKRQSAASPSGTGARAAHPVWRASAAARTRVEALRASVAALSALVWEHPELASAVRSMAEQQHTDMRVAEALRQLHAIGRSQGAQARPHDAQVGAVAALQQQPSRSFMRT